MVKRQISPPKSSILELYDLKLPGYYVDIGHPITPLRTINLITTVEIRCLIPLLKNKQFHHHITPDTTVVR